MEKYKGDESNAWTLIYGQCSPELKNKLEETEGCDGAKNTNDVAKLLTMIRGYCCQFDLLSDEYMAIVAAIKNLFYFFQKAEQSNADYHEDFMAMLEVIEEYGGAGSMTHFKHIYSRTNFDTTWPKAFLSTWWLLYPLLPQRRSESYSRLLFDLMCRNTEPSPCLPPTPPPPPPPILPEASEFRRFDAVADEGGEVSARPWKSLYPPGAGGVPA
jgi:hypothetical protein